MKFPRFLSLSVLLAALVLLPGAAAWARPDTHDAGISQQQAVSIAQQAHPGRVLGVKRKANEYQVKTLSANGEVRVIVIDAGSGKVIR